jgi:phage terminase large subunit
MTFDLSEIKNDINEKYYPYLWNTDRVLVLVGSAGSGKSWFVSQKLNFRIISEAGKVVHKFLIVRKTTPALKRSCWVLIQNTIFRWGLSKQFEINKSDMIITHKLTGSQFLFTSLDDEEKIKSIEGITGIWIEEATELTANDYRQLRLRLRKPIATYLQIVLSYNPVSKQAFTYKMFYLGDGKPKTYRVRKSITFPDGTTENYYVTVLHSTYKDNIKHLPRSYVAELEGMKDEDYFYYRVYALGEYADLLTTIYRNIEIVRSIPDLEFEPIFGGLDFGFNHPMVLLDVYKFNKEVYLKCRYFETGKTTMDLKEYLTKIKYDPRRKIYCDSAEPDRIEVLRKKGLSGTDGQPLSAFNALPAVKGNNSVLDGIDYLKTLHIKLLESDYEVVAQFQGYKWQEDKEGNVIDKPAKFNDDAPDAGRYPLWSESVYKKQIPHVREV